MIPLTSTETSFKLSGFEDDTVIDTEEVAIIELSQDIFSIKTRAPEGTADGGTVDRVEEHNRLIETSKVRGLAVVKITVQDADVNANGYSNCRVAKEVEREITNIGGRTQDYWQRTRDIAQQPLLLNPKLEEQVQEQTRGLGGNVAFQRMLELIKQECAGAFRKFLTKSVEEKVTESSKTFSSRQPIPFPDMARHGPHWVELLVKNPKLDGGTRRTTLAWPGQGCTALAPAVAAATPTAKMGFG
ncbi:hypothetical protein DL769_005442 [Monosporascus sp. CRB-8-3]|nr:hypothetical protein DL769_005442 [Monosporascus sp. CRB-8-3]